MDFSSVEGKLTSRAKALDWAERGALFTLPILFKRCFYSMVKGGEGLSIKSLLTLKPSFIFQTLLSFLLPPAPHSTNPIPPVVSAAAAP